MKGSAQSILHSSLMVFYNAHRSYFFQMYRICKKQNPISLRILDWLCTNYAKSQSAIITTDDSSVHLYHKYKNHLKGFGKKFFDPFCRKQTMDICAHNVTFTTTLGQLNFFKWAFENNVIGFAIVHRNAIESDMHERIGLARSSQRRNNTQGGGGENAIVIIGIQSLPEKNYCNSS